MRYFDYAATTPPYPEVVRSMAEMMEKHFGNPSSLHQYGEAADRLVRHAKEVTAHILGVKPSEIIWTSGATESNNFALKGATLRGGRTQGHIITTRIEHPSVYECCRQLEQIGFEISYIDPAPDGIVLLEDIQKALRADTIIVSMMHVNNETGAVQPVQQLAEWLKKVQPRTLIHVDGVQGFGKLPVELAKWNIDLYSLSAHKVRGPKGTGLLYIKQGTELFPLLAGGGQENGYRSGTENVAGIVGMTKALRLAATEQVALAERLTAFSHLIKTEIKAIDGLVLTNPAIAAPHIIHFCYPGMKSEVILHSLEQQGCIVSTQSACSSRKAEPSRVLLAMGIEREHAASGIRISLGDQHTKQDIEHLLTALRQTVTQLRPLERRTR